MLRRGLGIGKRWGSEEGGGGLAPQFGFAGEILMLVFFFSPFSPPSTSSPVSVRSKTQRCFVGVQLEGIILVAACVSGLGAGADCGAG